MAAWAERTAPSLDALAEIAEAALARLPAVVREAAAGCVLRVADWPDEETLAELDAEAIEITGLYRGLALTERSVADWGTLPDEIWLYRRPILDEWAERGDVPLGNLVAHVLVHEIAHHFGWSDDDIAAVDAWWR